VRPPSLAASLCLRVAPRIGWEWFYGSPLMQVTEEALGVSPSVSQEGAGAPATLGLPPVAWKAARLMGLAGCLGMAAAYALGLFGTPPDEHLKDAVRLLYVHAPTAWLALLCLGATAFFSLLYLIPRLSKPIWDLTALAFAEVGTVFLVLTVLLGSMWGRITWGVWWTWDARLTSTAILAVLFIGYLAVRRLDAPYQVRARRSAIVALVAAADLPVVHFSVNWWNTLHQGATVFRPNLSPTIHGSMLWTLLLAFAATTLIGLWMVWERLAVAVAEYNCELLRTRLLLGTRGKRA
jgi:heme exporter protein C